MRHELPHTPGESLSGRPQEHPGDDNIHDAAETAEPLLVDCGDFAVSDPAERARLAASRWAMLIQIRRPEGSPTMLPGAAKMIANYCAGRYPVSAVNHDVVAVIARVEDDSPDSAALAQSAARSLARLLRYPAEAVSGVNIVPLEDEPESALGGSHLTVVS